MLLKVFTAEMGKLKKCLEGQRLSDDEIVNVVIIYHMREDDARIYCIHSNKMCMGQLVKKKLTKK